MNKSSNRTFARIFLLIPLCLSAMQGAMAATIAVTTTSDDCPGPLRQTLDQASSGGYHQDNGKRHDHADQRRTRRR